MTTSNADAALSTGEQDGSKMQQQQHDQAQTEEDQVDGVSDRESAFMMDTHTERAEERRTEEDQGLQEHELQQQQQQQQQTQQKPQQPASPSTTLQSEAPGHGQHNDYDTTDYTELLAPESHVRTPTSPSPVPRNPNLNALPQPDHGAHRDDTDTHESDTLDDAFQNEISYEDEDEDDDDDELQQHDMPNRTVLEEERMHRKLMDMESSFFPEPSTIAVGGAENAGMDDTYLMGAHAGEDEAEEEEGDSVIRGQMTPRDAEEDEEEGEVRSEIVYPDADAAYGTPAPYRGHTPASQQDESLLAPETLSSPPTTAAADGIVRNVLSGTYTSANLRREQQEERDVQQLSETVTGYDVESTRRPISQQDALTVSQLGPPNPDAEAGTTTPAPERRRKRPKFLSRRTSSHRMSTSTVASVNTDATASDTTMGTGVDYALQSGGAAPESGSLRPPHSTRELSRTTSLGSMASGVSGLSDEGLLDRRGFSGLSEVSLQTLDEEEVGPQAVQNDSQGQGRDVKQEQDGQEDEQEQDNDIDAPPITPKAKAAQENAIFPGDTVTTQRFKDFIPSTSLRQQFREINLNASPNKQRPDTSGSAHGVSRGRHLTLKEQSSTIDRLAKENFDLKMKIHFLNEALSKRSEEGIQEMASENVELKSDKLRLQKDNHTLRKKLKDLERQMKDRGEDAEEESEKDGKGEESEGEKTAMYEEELLFLRDRIEEYEVEIEKWKADYMAQRGETRRIGEIVKVLRDGRGSGMGSESGVQEERVSVDSYLV